MSRIEIVDKAKTPDDRSSKDMSRKEFYFYIFGDLARGSYIVGSMFFDLIIIPQILSYVPNYYFLPSIGVKIGSILIPVLYIVIIVLLVALASFFEIKTYLRLWHK